MLDAGLKEVSAHPLGGLPTRARVSPGGHLAAWTVFVGGDSYAGTNFSTRTSVLDLRTGRLEASLEDFTILKDGKPYRSADVNFWGSPSPPTSGPSTRRWPPAAGPTWSAGTWASAP